MRIKIIFTNCMILLLFESQPVFCDDLSLDVTLIGVVSNSNNSRTLENVSVSILNGNSSIVISGGVTDESGKFRIHYNSIETINMVFEYIGYEKKYIYDVDIASNKNISEAIDLGDIFLVPAVIDLDAINVLATSRLYQVGLDKNVYKVSNNLMLQGKTGADALRAIPSVDVDIDGVVSLRGDKNITILVDGFPSGMASGDRRSRVDIIPAAIIDHIEIIANPSVDHDPSGMGGIINIITKRSSSRASELSGRLSAGTYRNFDGFLLMNFNNDRWGLSLSGNGKRDHQRLRSHREYEWEYPGLTLMSKQDRIEQLTLNTGAFNISGDYKISQGQTFNIGSNLIVFNSTSFDTIKHLDPVEYQMISKDDRRGFTLDIRGSHDWHSTSSDKRLRTDLSFSRSGEFEKDINDRNANGLGVNDHSHIYKDDAFQSIGFKTSYFMPYSTNMDLHIGAELFSRLMDQELDYLHVPFGFDHTELVQSLFLKSNYIKSDTYKFEGGLRVESLKTEGSVFEIELTDTHDHQDTTNVFMDLIDTSIVASPFLQSHFNLYPSARFWYYVFDDISINLNYSGRTNRPRSASINPFPVNMIDEYHVRVGNPMLRPEFIDIFEIGLNRKGTRSNLNGVVFFKKIQNMIQWHSVDIVRIESLQYEVISTENAGKGSSLGSEFHWYYAYNDKFSHDFSFNNWNTKIVGSETPDLNGYSSGYRVNTSISGLIQNSTKIEIAGYHRGLMQVPTGKIEPSIYFDIGIEKRFPAINLAINLTFKDIFDTRTYNIMTNETMLNLTSQQEYDQHLKAQRWNNYRSVVFSLNYAIGDLMKNIPFKRSESDIKTDYDY